LEITTRFAGALRGYVRRPAEPFAELTRTKAMIEESPAYVRRTVADRTQRPVRERFVLGRRTSLLVSAGVVSHTLWTSAAPALTYGLYAQEWHLSHTVTAGIFAVYPIGVVVMLVGFGGISDQIGRRATMLAGLFASLVGALLFAVAPDVWWVFAGRALMGIGVGLAASHSTAAIFGVHEPGTREECSLGHDGGAGNRLRRRFAARRRLDGIRAMADAPLLLDTCWSSFHPSNRDLVLAASCGRRCGRRLALADAIRSEGCTSGLCGVIDGHDGGLYVRRAGALARRSSRA
jgi:Major Facilitator Superfamily